MKPPCPALFQSAFQTVEGASNMKLVKWLHRVPDKAGYLMILPFFLIFIYFCLIPIVELLYNSMTDFALFGDSRFIGLQNYAALLRDRGFQRSFSNTITYSIGTLLPTMIGSFLLAQLVNSSKLKTRFSRAALFAPHVLSMVAVSMVWLMMYDPAYGYMNFFIKLFGGTPKRWLQDPSMALGSIMLMSVWKGIGYSMMIYLAALQGISQSYFEVAEIEGASAFQKMRYVTIPMVSSTTFFLFVTGIIGCFNVFEQVNVMTAGGPASSTTTIVHQIYTNAFAYFKMGYASAQSVVLLVTVSILTLINMRVGKKYNDVEIG